MFLKSLKKKGIKGLMSIQQDNLKWVYVETLFRVVLGEKKTLLDS